MQHDMRSSPSAKDGIWKNCEDNEEHSYLCPKWVDKLHKLSEDFRVACRTFDVSTKLYRLECGWLQTHVKRVAVQMDYEECEELS